MSLQTCWSLFFEIRPIFGFFFEIFDFARLTTEISRLARENRPPEKTAPRNQNSDSIGNLTVNFYKMDVHRPIYDRFPVLKCKVNTFQTHSKWSVDKSSCSNAKIYSQN